MTSNLKFPSSLTTCGSITVPSSDKTTGIGESDLHIYLTYNYVSLANPFLVETVCVVNDPSLP